MEPAPAPKLALVPQPPQPPVRQSLVRQPLEEAFRQHHELVFQTAFRITGSAADAEDVLQTVFLRLLRREGGDAMRDNPAGYLRRAAVHAGLDVLRARTRARVVPLEDGDGESGLPSPERQLAGRELRRLLRQAVAELSPRMAEIFVLRYFEGMSNPQIARLLGTSQAVVAVTLHRTRGRLRRQIRPLVGGGQ